MKKYQKAAIFAPVDKIINLTQHSATAEQIADGVVEPADKSSVQKCLTFNCIPSQYDMQLEALALVGHCLDTDCRTPLYKKAMIGGAPFFMSTLEAALKDAGIQPVYAFPVRESSEV